MDKWKGSLVDLFMRKHHICVCLLAYVAGCLLAYRGDVYLSILAVVSVVFAAGQLILYRIAGDKQIVTCWRWRMAVLLVAVSLVAGYGRTDHMSKMAQNFQQAVLTMDSIEINGVIARKEHKSNGDQLYLKRVSVTGQEQLRGSVLWKTEGDTPMVGSEIRITGYADAFEDAANEGAFDAAKYYQYTGIACSFYATTECEVLSAPRFPVKEYLYRFQEQLLTVYTKELNARDAGILSTLILGDKSLLDADVRAMYQAAGIAHILAISGLHVSVIGYSVYRLLRKRKCSYLLSALAGALLVALFVVMSGMGIASVRAMIMYIVMMGANVTGRTYDFANAVSIAAWILLIWNPMSIFQAGFLFSFLAMAGIGSTTGILQHKLQEKMPDGEPLQINRIQQFLIHTMRSLMASALLQLWLLPLMAWYYYEIPVYSIFLNVIVLALSTYLIWFGISGGIIGLICPVASQCLLLVCHWILSCYEQLMQAMSRLPCYEIITGRPESYQMLFYYGFLILIMGIINGTIRNDIRQNIRSRWNKIRLLLAMVFCALSFVLFAPRDEGSFRVDFLDVGQGDGICICGSDGHTVLIDGGSTTQSEVGRYALLPYLKYHGVRKADIWIITHCDADHISGVMELLNAGYPVDQLLIAKAAPDDKEKYDLEKAAVANGTDVVYISAGAIIDMGTVHMTCLYPEAGDFGERNDMSQVWLLEEKGQKLLLTGDITSEQETDLMLRNRLCDIDVLKVAHHGSKYSTSDNFLELTDPEAAIISCGRFNHYGHPHEETLQRLERNDCLVVKTMDHGQVRLTDQHGTWTLAFPCED